MCMPSAKWNRKHSQFGEFVEFKKKKNLFNLFLSSEQLTLIFNNEANKSLFDVSHSLRVNIFKYILCAQIE